MELDESLTGLQDPCAQQLGVGRLVNPHLPFVSFWGMSHSLTKRSGSARGQRLPPSPFDVLQMSPQSLVFVMSLCTGFETGTSKSGQAHEHLLLAYTLGMKQLIMAQHAAGRLPRK